MQGREHQTRHSLLSAYLHVVCQDGGASEFLAEYDEHIALASYYSLTVQQHIPLRRGRTWR